jgi:hypothetical protein
VRLLVDDITPGARSSALGLAGHRTEVACSIPSLPGVPRAGGWWRCSDFRRLDHRMLRRRACRQPSRRNVADGISCAVRSGNFFDIDLVLVGARSSPS